MPTNIIYSPSETHMINAASLALAIRTNENYDAVIDVLAANIMLSFVNHMVDNHRYLSRLGLQDAQILDLFGGIYYSNFVYEDYFHKVTAPYNRFGQLAALLTLAGLDYELSGTIAGHFSIEFLDAR